MAAWHFEPVNAAALQTYAIFTEVEWGTVRRQLENAPQEGLSPTKLALGGAADDTVIVMEW